MITTDDVKQADARATEARKRAAHSKLKGFTDGAEDAVQRAVVAAEDLKVAKSRQDEALLARKAAEKPHAAELKKLSTTLDESAALVAEAAQEATEAVARLASVMRSHNAVTSAVHDRLVLMQLPVADEATAYATGAGAGGKVRVDGVDWSPVPVDTVTRLVLAEGLKRVFGPKHPGGRVDDPRVHSLLRGAGGAVVDRLTAA